MPADRNELEALLTEALPYVDFDARYWNEDASEEQNRRRQAEAAAFAERIRAALAGSTQEDQTS
jgi:hypothetical protein